MDLEIVGSGNECGALLVRSAALFTKVGRVVRKCLAIKGGSGGLINDPSAHKKTQDQMSCPSIGQHFLCLDLITDFSVANNSSSRVATDRPGKMESLMPVPRKRSHRVKEAAT